jgi:large subunit ribosomal protein L4
MKKGTKAKSSSKSSAKSSTATKAAPPTKAEAKVLSGGKVSTREVDLAPYGTSRRRALLKQVVIAYQANARQGTHKTKTRAETSYSEAKPWPQKHTGRARAGDKNSPLWRHGGTIHGPVPRDYRQHTPRRMLREALRSALFGKFVDGEVAFADNLDLTEPSTKSAAKCLKDLGAERGATIVLEQSGGNDWRSFRNIHRCDVVPAAELNALHVLKRPLLVFVGASLDGVEQRLAGETPAVAAEKA